MKQGHSKPAKHPHQDVPRYLEGTAADWQKTLKSPDGLERRLAVYALGELGAAARQAVPDLQVALHDPESFVRVWAAAALNRVEPRCAECLDVLVECLHDPLNYVRSLAAWHMGRNGPDLPGLEKALPALESLLEDENLSVRSEAAIALKKIEGKIGSPPELQVLAHTTSSDNPDSGRQDHSGHDSP